MINNVKLIALNPSIDPRKGAENFELETLTFAKGEHYPNAKLIPWLGKEKWDGHIFVAGPTGSGKTFLINEIVFNDFKKRKAFLFSDVRRKDPSFDPIWKNGQLKRVSRNPKEKWEISPQKVPIKKNIILIFDDTNDPQWITLRDKVLERGRHHEIMAICVSHKLRDRGFTKVPKNESRWIITYPFANKTEISRFLQEQDMNMKQRSELIQLSIEDGRYLIFHNFAPTFVLTEHSLVSGV